MISVKDYTFINEDLIKTALTHSSYSQNNYERLEFLGDSILDFVVGKYFYNTNEQNEGVLTKLRSHFVSEDNLSLVFDKLNITDYVRLGKSCREITKSIKCDMFEAVVAAIFLDSDMQICEKFVLDNIFLENIDQIELLDSKSMLQEYVQANKMTVAYKLISQTGESHKPTFVVEASVGEMKAVASSTSKQLAEQISAKKILEILRKEKN